MKHFKHLFSLTGCLRGAVVGLAAIALPLSHAATLWTGPNTNWTKSVSTPSDTILAGKVVLTRGTRQVLYNTALGETALSPDALGSGSPAGTLWAFGTFASHTAFQTMESMRNLNLAGLILNQPMVMWITNDDIFVSVKFTTWGQFGAGTVAYTRSTPPAAVAPTVSITNPVSGAVFAAPANVKIAASATVSGGTVTNVSFFNNNTNLLGSAQSAPFSITANNLAATAYSLTAVATASGVAATSSVVNITVVSPIAVNLTSPHISGGLFAFNYSANPGLRYVVQRSSNLFTWVPVVTNVASSSPVPFSEGVIANPPRYYRVGRLPNP